MNATKPVVDLGGLAEEVRQHQAAARRDASQALEANLAIGRCLLEARHTLRSDTAFGGWLRAEAFGFSNVWAWTLREAATNEDAVRAAVLTQVKTGQAFNFKKAVAQVRNASKPNLTLVAGTDSRRADHDPLADYDEFPTVVIDPPWRYDNVATRGAAEDHYPTMSYDELATLEVPSSTDAHLYLWVTNPFMRQGLDLCDAWGFTYKTLLTWVKPQMGMGNWFRSATEHVIFGVKGKQPTLRNDVLTWFEADRQRHSQKPESFYDLVESCSPGPYFEMFARRRRLGWSVWGNEA